MDARFTALISSIGLHAPLHAEIGTVWNGAPNGIPCVVASGSQPRRPVRLLYEDDSGRCPWPLPADAPIVSRAGRDGDRHVLVLDRDHEVLNKRFRAFPQDGGACHTGCVDTTWMMQAGNGGNWFISGAPDPRWDDDAGCIAPHIRKNLEVVRMGRLVCG